MKVTMAEIRAERGTSNSNSFIGVRLGRTFVPTNERETIASSICDYDIVVAIIVRVCNYQIPRPGI